jgi:hypothetical protein
LREFFQRLQASVEVDDLRRFARIIMDDLTHVLDGHEIVVRLLDTKEREAELEEDVRKALLTNRVWVEPETGRLQIPVLFQGKPLALVAATPLHGRALADGVITILPTVIRLSLEKLLLYKIYITDRETGLNNEDYFLTYLRKQLVAVNRPAQKRDGTPQPLSLSEKTSHDGLTVILVEVEDFQGLEATHGRLEAVRVLTSLADWMRMAHSGPSCLARLDRGVWDYASRESLWPRQRKSPAGCLCSRPSTPSAACPICVWHSGWLLTRRILWRTEPRAMRLRQTRMMLPG